MFCPIPHCIHHTLFSQFFNDCLNLLIQLVALCDEGFKFGVDLSDIDHLAGVFLLYITRYREVGIVLENVVIFHQLRQILFVLAILEKRHNLVLMLGQKHVLVAILLEEFAGIDEEH